MRPLKGIYFSSVIFRLGQLGGELRQGESLTELSVSGKRFHYEVLLTFRF